MSAIAATLRVDWTQYVSEADGAEPDGSGTDADGADPTPRIYAFWHGRVFLLVPAFRDRGAVIITSTSFAGEVLTRMIERFGYAAVRGARGRRGMAALIAMKSALAQGHDCGIAPDGPSGPERRSKGGAVAAALSSGCPIVPVGIGARPAWAVPHTWDRFIIPMLFARCAVVVGRPIPSTELAGMDLEDLDAAINEVTDEADRRAGGRADTVPDRQTHSNDHIHGEIP